MASRYPPPYIFLKFTFPSSISCHCSLSCAFPSLFKLWVRRVERTFLVAGHWYANQSNNRHKNLPLWFLLWGCLVFKAGIPASVHMQLAIRKLSLKYSEVRNRQKYWKKGNLLKNWKLRLCTHLVSLSSHLNTLYGGIYNTPATGMGRRSNKWYRTLFT